jgi:N utilization substance protein A
MNAKMILQIVDSLHHEKSIDKELVFQAIESALVSASRKYYGEETVIEFTIDRKTGDVTGHVDNVPLDFEEAFGRIGAQTAKQIIIQKVREAERDVLLEEFREQIGQLVNGTVQRNEGSVTIVTLGQVESILPRSERIPGETNHPNERIRAVIAEVKTQGNKVKIVLSRSRKELVQRLFEQEIPEIADGVITINAISREPGYRSKVAVSSSDPRVDCLGACVGLRGNRIKNVIDELAGERIDVVRYSEDPQEFIREALKPAVISEVIPCQMMGRAIALVAEDQTSLAIGRRGQNVRLASKLCGWDIDIMTQDELEKKIEKAVAQFSAIEGIDEDLANRLVAEGYLSYDDLSVIEPDDLMEMGDLSAEQVERITETAEELGDAEEKVRKEELAKRRAEEAQAEARRVAEEEERIAAGGDEPPLEESSSEESLADASAESTEEGEPSAQPVPDGEETVPDGEQG